MKGNNLHGGRGLAFWYAKDPKETGPVFGSKDKWDGLSVWLDSANPRVSVCLDLCAILADPSSILDTSTEYYDIVE